MSVEPPAAQGTINVTGRSGQAACAAAGSMAAASATMDNALRIEEKAICIPLVWL